MTKFIQKIKKDWKKTQYINFSFVILMAILMIAGILINWVVKTQDYIASINKLSVENQRELIKLDLLPKLISNYWGYTSTFTYLSNTFLILAFGFLTFLPKKSFAQKMAFLATVYITITFVVFWTLIFPDSLKKGVYSIPNFIASVLIHFVNPAIGFGLLILNRKHVEISKKTIWLSFIPLIIFYLFALCSFLIGQSTVQHLSEANSENANLYNKLHLQVYAFLNFAKPLFYSGENKIVVVLLNILIVVVGLILTPALGLAWKHSLKIKYQNFIKNN
ncbi:MAGa3780 family membrane protein [Mycoplasmopsis iners]|uniref:MAGa3780 family membrane protein n=1 Tax=Mycoplasmopsis iners TaxID=76630 RepID=UPI000495F14C|nr:hypothetical protein [Mycoplasmopsis iners]